jgi:hypothetical protein
MAYLGSTPEYQSFTSGTDYFNGDGISVAFTLSRPVASVNDIEVVISNVVQQPSTAYTVSGTTITFTSAPPAGTANVYARYLSTVTQTITPSPGTVGTSQLSPSLTNIPFFGGSTLGAGNATGMKNRLINGGMVLDQRNGGASTTFAGIQYGLDRWESYAGTGSGHALQQVTDAPTGFSNSLKITIGTGATPSSAQQNIVWQPIEGYNVADLDFGLVTAKTITFSFWVKSSVTGTFNVWFSDASPSRSYVSTYTVNSANTWENKTVTVIGETSGTWLKTNGAGLLVGFSLGCGSNFDGPANTWSSADYKSTSGATSIVNTSGATWQVTGAQLEEGNAATSFEFRDYGRELMMCQRYYYNSYPSGSSGTGHTFAGGVIPSAASIAECCVGFPISMRTAPTVTFPDGLGQSGVAAGTAATASQIDTTGFLRGNKTSGSFTAASSLVTGGFIASAEL